VVRGSSRGFVRSLLGPFSIIVASILSIVYYQNTKEMVLSLAIGLVGPLFLQLLLKSFLKTWAKATNTDVKPDFLSRFGGSILTLIWGWVFIVFTLILLVVLPPLGKTLAAVHNDVVKSISYCRIAKPLEDTFFATSKKNIPVATNTDLNLDVKSLTEDPRFQKVLQDPDIQQDIDTHDIVKLMSNPKMMALTQQIMSDPETIKKVMALYSSQIKPQTNFGPSSTSNSAN
jgi:hypothetical protein